MRSTTTSGYYCAHPQKSADYHLLIDAKSTNLLIANKAKTQLLERNEGFLRKFIGPKVHRDNPHFDDVMQDARRAFLTAIDRYDFGQSASIHSYARWYLKKVLHEHFRYLKHAPGRLPEDNDPGVPAFKVTDPVLDRLKEVLEDAIKVVLTKIEAEVISLRYFEGMKSKDIANTRGCTEARISKILKTALLKLRVYLNIREVTPTLFD